MSTCVLADQVVKAVAAVCGFGQQIVVIDVFEQVPRLVHVGAIEGGGGICVDLRPGVQAQMAEYPLLVRGEVLVGKVKGGINGEILGMHEPQPIPRPGKVAG